MFKAFKVHDSMKTPADKLLRLLIASTFCSALLATPALSQNYHYGNGTARVVNQNQTGLYYSESTYIGPGTISKTAQGKQVGGAQANPLLPKVPWGANIQTPGDNFYTNQRVTKTTNQGVPAGVPQANWGANVKQPGDNMRSDMGQAPIQYTPGQVFQKGNRGAGGASGSQQRGYMYKPGYNGMATYGDDSANGAGSTTTGNGTKY